LESHPDLRDPWLVAAFDGWPNAGGVAVQAMHYLRTKLGAAKFADIAPQEFYSFAVLRPLAVIEEGVVKGVRFPLNEFYSWKDPGGHRDLILFSGAEPHRQWRHYLDCVYEVVREFRVARVVSLGATYDRVPHTLDPRISASANDESLVAELTGLGLHLTSYMGPCSIHTVMLEAFKEHHLLSSSLWGHVPHYLQVGNPPVAGFLLQKLLHMIGIEVDLSDIRLASEEFQEMLKRFMAEKPEMREYVRQLEEETVRDGEVSAAPLGADHLMREVEEFLKQIQQGRGGDDQPPSPGAAG